jgi:hypothetical protein
MADDFTLQSDGPFNQDFDELMRSGATMKVSLTPDRLKTFEVRPLLTNAFLIGFN